MTSVSGIDTVTNFVVVAVVADVVVVVAEVVVDVMDVVVVVVVVVTVVVVEVVEVDVVVVAVVCVVVVGGTVLERPGSQISKTQKFGSVMGADSARQNSVPLDAPLSNVT